MATVNPTFSRVGDYEILFTYAAMANGDVGAAIPPLLNDYSDRTIQATGTMGAGGSLTIQGSNDGTNFFDLTDGSNSAIAITTQNKSEQIFESSAYMRPKVTAGDGTTAITAIVSLRREPVGKR